MSFQRWLPEAPRLFHIFQLVISEEGEHRLSDGLEKFQEWFGLASQEPVSIVKRMECSQCPGLAPVPTSPLVPVGKEMECSDAPVLGPVHIHGSRA